MGLEGVGWEGVGDGGRAGGVGGCGDFEGWGERTGGAGIG